MLIGVKINNDTYPLYEKLPAKATDGGVHLPLSTVNGNYIVMNTSAKEDWMWVEPYDFIEQWEFVGDVNLKGFREVKRINEDLYPS